MDQTVKKVLLFLLVLQLQVFCMSCQGGTSIILYIIYFEKHDEMISDIK